MKSRGRLLLLAGSIGLTFTMSCSKDRTLKKAKEEVEDQAENGTWRITVFNEDGNNELYHFTGYNFTFGNDDKLTAANGSTTYTGTWNITENNSSDDSPTDLDFNINFNLSNELEDLNDDWDIISHSDSKIELRDVSGGNGGIDHLTFERN